MSEKQVKKHIKMYGKDDFIEAVKVAAKEEGVTQSNFVFMATKEKIKRMKK